MSGRDRISAARLRLAYEAARIMAEQGGTDFERARRKAAERTGIVDRRSWPSNEAIQEALLTQCRLFRGEAHGRELDRLRRDALKAMERLRAFSPRLVGPALTGSAPAGEGQVQLHLFADRPEDVILFLFDLQIPWQERERSFRYSGGERRNHPVFRFVAGDTPFELIALPRQALRNPPLDAVTDRPERGMGIDELERLIEEGEDGQPYPRDTPIKCQPDI
jgi:hypothetical protein